MNTNSNVMNSILSCSNKEDFQKKTPSFSDTTGFTNENERPNELLSLKIQTTNTKAESIEYLINKINSKRNDTGSIDLSDKDRQTIVQFIQNKERGGLAHHENWHLPNSSAFTRSQIFAWCALYNIINNKQPDNIGDLNNFVKDFSLNKRKSEVNLDTEKSWFLGPNSYLKEYKNKSVINSHIIKSPCSSLVDDHSYNLSKIKELIQVKQQAFDIFNDQKDSMINNKSNISFEISQKEQLRQNIEVQNLQYFNDNLVAGNLDQKQKLILQYAFEKLILFKNNKELDKHTIGYQNDKNFYISSINKTKVSTTNNKQKKEKQEYNEYSIRLAYRNQYQKQKENDGKVYWYHHLSNQFASTRIRLEIRVKYYNNVSGETIDSISYSIQKVKQLEIDNNKNHGYNAFSSDISS